METSEKTKHILFVEDEDDSRTVISMFLESQGFKVTSSPDGENALEKLCFFKEKKITVDLVITDLIMPWIGGMELITNIIERHINIPVLIITAYGNEITESRLRELGCNSILEKPFPPGKLLNTINKTMSI